MINSKKFKYLTILALLVSFLIINTTFNSIQNNSNFESRNLKTSSDTGWTDPTEVTQFSDGGSWWSRTNIYTEDDSYAYTYDASMSYSKILRAYNFGFEIPENSTIIGIEVRINKYCIYDSVDYNVSLYKSVGLEGDNKADTETHWDHTDTEIYVIYGDAEDTWGYSWTREEINSENFGIGFASYFPDVIMGHRKVDHIQIKIYYSTEEAETDPPTWDTLTESEDPLELGDNETIHINVYDESDISTVYLEFGGNNYSMNFETGNTYNYTNWKPISTGIKNYTIHMIDEFGNTNQTGIFNITVQDTSETDPPTWDTLTESADPLPLGNTETININIYDDSTINNVYLEISGTNWTMTYISGDTWRNSTWTPLSIGVKIYQIHMIDQWGNINQTTDLNITVYISGDITPPTWTGLIEWSDPQSIGINITIQINVTDGSGVLFVYIQIQNVNYSMRNETGTYFYSNWLPENFGIHNYTIIMIDTLNNTTSIQGQVSIVNILNPFVIIMLFIFILGLNLYIFMKVKKGAGIVLLLFVSLFNIFLVVQALSVDLPLAPYTQVFFLMVNLLLLTVKTLKH